MINNLDIDDFLRNYWQKKPLLIRSAFPKFQSPISAEELAGLACEDFIESRIISEHKSSPKWKLENGPFSEKRFPKLPESHWTLLIQGLNKIFPELDILLHEFNFIPSWRLDDLMASYAAPEGSVGPHIDQYDVFLLQASGRRKWLISEAPVAKDNFLADSELKIIKNFKAETEWILEAGDMLYLPPNVAHYGIGLEDCITFSIGFRAPSHAELLSSYIDEHITTLKDELRYKDPVLTDSQNCGEISVATIDGVQDLLLSHFEDKSRIEDWFCRFVTDYLNGDDEYLNENSLNTGEFIALFKTNKFIRRPATVRASYHINNKNILSLYINGNKQPILSASNEVVKLFCNQIINHYADIESYLKNNHVATFLCELYNSGYIEFEDDDLESE
jgi:50S ribosomal protein L16 3-hydroxylase